MNDRQTNRFLNMENITKHIKKIFLSAIILLRCCTPSIAQVKFVPLAGTNNVGGVISYSLNTHGQYGTYSLIDKAWADSMYASSNTYLPLTGGTMTGDIMMQLNNIYFGTGIGSTHLNQGIFLSSPRDFNISNNFGQIAIDGRLGRILMGNAINISNYDTTANLDITPSSSTLAALNIKNSSTVLTSPQTEDIWVYNHNLLFNNGTQTYTLNATAAGGLAALTTVNTQSTAVSLITNTLNIAPTRYILGSNNLLNYVPMNTGSPNYITRVLFSMKLPPNVPVGSGLNISLGYEVTNPTSYNIQDTYFIKYSNSPTDTAYNNYITPPQGFNSTPAQHHSVTDIGNTYYCPTDFSNKYLNVVVYYASSSYVPGDLMHVEGNGQIKANGDTAYNWFNCAITPPQNLSNDTIDISTKTWWQQLAIKPSNTVLHAVDSFVVGVKQDGNWQFDGFFIEFAGNLSTSYVNLASNYPQIGTSVGSTVSVTGGIQGDGSSFAIETPVNTGYGNPLGNFQLNNGCVGVYNLSTTMSAPTAVQCLIGITGEGGINASFLAYYQGYFFYGINETGYSSNTYTTSATNGHWMVERTGANTENLYLNGASVASTTTIATGEPPVGLNIYAHALHNNTLLNSFSPAKTALFYIGSGNIDPVKLDKRIQRLKINAGF